MFNERERPLMDGAQDKSASEMSHARECLEYCVEYLIKW